VQKLTDRLNYLADTSMVEAGVNTTEGYVSGVRSAFPHVRLAAMEMTDIIAKISSDSDNNIGVHFELTGEEGILEFIEKVIINATRLFETGTSGIVRIVINKFTEMMRTVQDIIRRMMYAVDNIFRVEGFNTGRNLARAMGEGLISEQANLLSLATQTANSIRTAFDASPISAMPLNVQAKDDDRNRNSSPIVIKQYFYGVKEKQTSFEAYRAVQKAIAMEVR